MTEFPELYVNKYTASDKSKKLQQMARLTISSSPSSKGSRSPLRNSAMIEPLNFGAYAVGNGGEAEGGNDEDFGIPAPPLEPPFRNGFLRPLSDENITNK